MYYPKSQITTNLYTNGDELFIKSNNLNYIGYYYKLSTGKTFAGKKPSTGIIELVPREDLDFSSTSAEEDITKVISVLNFPSDPDPEGLYPNPDENFFTIKNNGPYSNLIPLPEVRKIPSHYTPIVTQSDINVGEILRYYAKKTNNTLYLEISPDDFLALKTGNPKIAFDLYECVSIPWSLTDEADEINRKLVNNIERNRRWYGFHHYFKGRFGNDEGLPESLYTNGGEFLLPNRTNYIGFYHFMPDGRVMSGKFHGEGGEIILVPLGITPQAITSSPTTTSTSTSSPSVSAPSYSPPASSGGGGGGY